ncbi:GNAT family N-acetyltransferase [Anaerofustis sp.]|uniref:GNAT family N-acetyltransferase n=1 Tax=Anaerofustis sp. TaxID=1872517 RepID=UPI0025BA16BE|nr:GNAT family N-acetyltransferase [Anaerofustis sp.]
MIEKYKNKFLDDIMHIWIEENLRAHNFIDKNYFINNFDMVKSILSDYDIYVFREDDSIKGFIGIDERGYIEGIFVSDEYKGKKIGTALIKKAKENYDKLSLSVFKKNKKALNFYIKCGFEIEKESIDSDTNEVEYLMVYKKM